MHPSPDKGSPTTIIPPPTDPARTLRLLHITRAAQARLVARRTRPAPAPLFPNRQPIAIRWIEEDWMRFYGGGLYMSAYLDNPPRIYMHRPTWARLSLAERRHLICHEIAHHLLPGTLHRNGGNGGERALQNHAYRRTEAATTALGDHLGCMPDLGRVLVVAGVLTAADGAWLDSLGSEAGVPS